LSDCKKIQKSKIFPEHPFPLAQLNMFVAPDEAPAPAARGGPWRRLLQSQNVDSQWMVVIQIYLNASL